MRKRTTMQITPVDTGTATAKGPAEWFTGDVYIDTGHPGRRA
jgi:hypothetical protein